MADEIVKYGPLADLPQPPKRKRGRPKGSFSNKDRKSAELERRRLELEETLQRLGLKRDENSERILKLLMEQRVPLTRESLEKIDVDSYTERKLFRVIEAGYNDRVRLEALKILMAKHGLLNTGTHIQIQQVQGRFSDETSENPPTQRVRVDPAAQTGLTDLMDPNDAVP